jgi:hypothetical protein
MQRISHRIKALKERLYKKFYSARTHNLLNYFSLNIKDDEIKATLKNFRLRWQDRVYLVCLFCLILDTIFALALQFGTKTNDAVQVLMSANAWLVMGVWFLLRKYLPGYVFVVPVLYLFVHDLVLNLLVVDKILPVFKIKDKNVVSEQLLMYFLQANLVNFMDIKFTIIVFVPMFLLG